MRQTRIAFILMLVCICSAAYSQDSSSTTLSAAHSAISSAAAQQTAVSRDGARDFDGLLGGWKYHLKRRLNPLTGSDTWVEYQGTGNCEKIWDGAELDRAVFDAPNDHIEGFVVRLYNPQSHQWRLYWTNRKNGIFDPPQIGEFTNGRGEFVAQDTINGKTVLVRFVWTKLDTASPHFEQSFSNDGGKNWEVNWITDQTRLDNAKDTH